MKIETLEIAHFRGIRSLKVVANGQNLVILGPNGSGKSTIVDAVDFLLTGKIGRLTGRGSGGLSLNRHGPHIRSDPEHAIVRAHVTIPGVAHPIEISRCVASPTVLVCEDNARAALLAALPHAEHGQHVLTRRELLRFITAEPRDRADAVQAVLDLTGIEAVRQRLVRAKGDLERSAAVITAELERQEARVAAAAGVARVDETEMLEAVNRARAMLGGEALAAAEGDLRRDIIRPEGTRALGPSTDSVRAAAAGLSHSTNAEGRNELRELDSQLQQAIASVRSVPGYARVVDSARLIHLGISFIPETGECPLCGAAWAPGQLRAALAERAQQTSEVQAALRTIDDLAGRARSQLARAEASAEQLNEAATVLDAAQSGVAPRAITRIAQLIEALTVPLEQYAVVGVSISELLDAVDDLGNIDELVSRAEARTPLRNPAQDAWDLLTATGEALGARLEVRRRLDGARRAARRAHATLEAYQAQRTEVLGALYDNVCARFVALYQRIHGENETGFTAELRPGAAGLGMTVEFMGHGQHPPHALHSEGHQDSMGLCLFLALAEWLGRDAFQLIILDDVVMSVDADHRRNVADLLAHEFPDKQFLITTHDRTWAYQLKASGATRTQIEFFDWSIEAGPHVQQDPDQWEQIEAALAERDVAGAAAKLRRGSEEYFSSVCEALEALVPYRADARWDLGAVMPAAVARFRKLLKEARQAAERWNNAADAIALGEREGVVGQIYDRTQAEQWAVNPAVHYNRWLDLTPNDLRPVIEAMRDLFDALRCPQCRGLYRVLKQGGRDASITCLCGGFSATLLRP